MIEKKLEKSICKMKMKIIEEDCKDEEFLKLFDILQVVTTRIVTHFCLIPA